MSTQVYETTWHQQQAWVIESETVRATMVPGMGAKIASLVDKTSQFEWLIGPGSRPVRPVAYGAWWHEQDMSGWDEMFPTIVSCAYPGPGAYYGAALPDHGEAWTLPWSVEGAGDSQLTLCLEGQALPYRLERTATCAEAGVLRLDYRLTNYGKELMPYIWAAHPQFVCGAYATVLFPPEVTAVINTIPESWGWGEPETRFDWPEARMMDGRRERIDLVGSPVRRRGRKFFALPDVRAGWAAVQRLPEGRRPEPGEGRRPAEGAEGRGPAEGVEGRWLRFEWDPGEIPYLGLWVDEGALNHESVATPEPTTGFYDDLQLAWKKGCVQMVAAGGVREWSLTVRLGAGGRAAPGPA